MFTQQSEQMRGQVESGFTSIFRACNLQGALSLLEELTQSEREDATLSSQCFPGNSSNRVTVHMHIPFSQNVNMHYCPLK